MLWHVLHYLGICHYQKLCSKSLRHLLQKIVFILYIWKQLVSITAKRPSLAHSHGSYSDEYAYGFEGHSSQGHVYPCCLPCNQGRHQAADKVKPYVEHWQNSSKNAHGQSIFLAIKFLHALACVTSYGYLPLSKVVQWIITPLATQDCFHIIHMEAACINHSKTTISCSFTWFL